MKSTVLLIDYTNLHVKCTHNLLFAKWAKLKLRFWRIFQTGACYMIPLQTRVAHNTLIMLISVFWTNSANIQGFSWMMIIIKTYLLLVYSIITWCFSHWPSYRSEACCIGLRRSRRPIQQTECRTTQCVNCLMYTPEYTLMLITPPETVAPHKRANELSCLSSRSTFQLYITPCHLYMVLSSS
jgi:hypothetical protein